MWEQLQITSVREFIALERAAFRVWKRAGGSISDATRIVDIKLRFSEKMDAAYRAFILSEDTHGRHDPQLEKQWSKFKVVFRRVGQAVARSGGSLNYSADAVPAAAQAQRTIRPVVSDRRTVQQQPAARPGTEEQRLLKFNNLCFEHSKLGVCSYGAECRFAHEGEPGALRHLVVDGNGDRVQFEKYGNCRRLDRGRCTFKHDPASVQQQPAKQQSAPANSTAVMTEEQHRQIVNFAAANGRDASMVTLEEAQSAARAPAARRVFTVLHQDKAEKIRKMRPKAVEAIQWKKWTKENEDFNDEEEDYYEQ